MVIWLFWQDEIIWKWVEGSIWHAASASQDSKMAITGKLIPVFLMWVHILIFIIIVYV
jgi:hypothetical protein